MEGVPLPRSTAPRRSIALFAALVLGLLITAAACSTGKPYVSLGDSYVSGPFIPVQQPNPLGCLRSDHNYPHVTAGARGLNLTDVSCSGATTFDMTHSQAVTWGTNPPQLNAVNSSTKVVTLGIGGNDIGFSSVIENCVAGSSKGPTRVGQTCKDFYTAGGKDQLAAAINATAPKVATVLQQIHAKAKSAKVFVVGYPAILPNRGTGCYPQMPLTVTDVPYLRGVEKNLNAMLKTEAGTNGAVYVDTYTPSVGFNACTAPVIRWVEPVVPVNAAAPVHPNIRGEAGMAGVVEMAMRSAGF